MNIVTSIGTGYIRASRPVRRRGFTRLMVCLAKVFPRMAKEPYTATLANGASFTFPAGDPCWIVTCIDRNPYEPELIHILERLPETPSLFLDCGANYGYWSVMVGQNMKTVAVEASSENFAWLSRNRADNGNSFTAIHAAITDGYVSHVSFSTTGASTGRSIVSNSKPSETVPAVTIDQLAEQHNGGKGITFVKLDVEGVEIAALRGAEQTLRGRSLIFYEDHGKEADCEITAFLLSQGRTVIHVTRNGDVIPIRSVSDAKSVKVRRSKGYNFLTFGDNATDIAAAFKA